MHNECRAGYCADRVWPAIPPEIDYISLDNVSVAPRLSNCAKSPQSDIRDALPAALQRFCHTSNASLDLRQYCRDDKYCNVSADVVGEATVAAAEAQHYLMPLLQPHQRLWAVPGLFGPASARGAAARAAYDALLVGKLEGWLKLIRGDARWVGLMGWHWPSMNSISAEYALGAAAFPKLQAALAQAKPPPLPPLNTLPSGP